MSPELLSRWWLVLTVPAGLVGIGLLTTGIVSLLRVVGVPEFARLPLVPEQDVDLGDAGPLSFVIDKPRFRNVQAHAALPFALSVSVADAAGRSIKAHAVLMPVSVHGVTRTRVEVATLASVSPGRYRLHVAGLVADIDSTDTFIVVTRPVSKLKLVICILTIIAGAVLALGGLIASLATMVKFQSG